MISEILAEELDISNKESEATIKLIEEGNTIPFIAKYRKDISGLLNEDIVWKFAERLNYLKKLEKEKKKISSSIAKEDRLSDDVKESISNARTLLEIEDINRQYVLSEQTKASLAKEKGLNKLANIIRFQKTEIPIEEIAKDFLSEEHEINTIDDAINGAKDIIAQMIADNSIFKTLIRRITYEEGEIIVRGIEDEENSVYELYYQHEENVSGIANHKILAINRGEKEGFLDVKIIGPKKEIIDYLNRHTLIDFSNDYKEEYNEITKPFLEEAVLDAYDRLIAPSVEKEIREYLTKKAEDRSIKIFSKNLENLLMQHPIRNKVVLGWYPLYPLSIIAIIDKNGEVLATDSIFPIGSKEKKEESKQKVLKLIEKYNVDIIALGDNRDVDDLEKIIVDIIKGTNVKYALINQAGASVYSSSVLGSMEFPNFDKSQRTAISIARRLQDPLSELVKVDPKSIGVGQYQHDMEEKKLNKSLIKVVEKIVNKVGVDLNKASLSLLVYVSGLDSAIATNILKYRDEHGGFKNREELKKVDGIDSNIFKQCAGFLKVYSSENKLDKTSIHPESYDIAIEFVKKIGYDLTDLFLKDLKIEDLKIEDLANELNIGKYTLKDIISELKSPKDPRDDMVKSLLRSKIFTIEDLKKGMEMKGTVKNVVDFGAFIDLGVHHDGLLHISKMNKGKFVEHPSVIVNVGDVLKIKIFDVDINAKRIQLDMITE